MTIKNRSKICLIISAVIILVALGLHLSGNGINLGIDFAGGLSMQYDMKTAVTSADVTNVLENMGVTNSTVTVQGRDNNEVNVRIKDITKDEEVLVDVKGLYPIDEAIIDAGTAVSGCGPAFAYLMIDAMADGGVACGLPRADAVRYAAQTLIGAARMVLETGKHPDQLRDEVCSPGGTTIVGVKILEDLGMRSAMSNAVDGTIAKSREMSQE